MHRPQWARASSFTWFLDHTQRLTTVDRTPIDCYSAVISGPRDHRPRHLTCDNSLLCPRTHTHTNTHTHTHIHQLTYLLTYLLPSLLSPLCRFVVYSGIGFCWPPYLHRHPTLLLCLLRDNITRTTVRARHPPAPFVFFGDIIKM